MRACAAPTGLVSDGTDCDDASAGVNPGAIARCNDVDDDCDGAVDEAGAAAEITRYIDSDADGWGTASSAVTACDRPTGYANQAGDCDDMRSGRRRLHEGRRL